MVAEGFRNPVVARKVIDEQLKALGQAKENN